MSNELKLTKTDYEVLQSYCTICEGLSVFLGNAYEIIIHSLEDVEHSAIYVVNGFHSGRTVGAPITDLALKMLKKIQSNDSLHEYYCYFTKNQAGKLLKSTTIPIYGENQRTIGLLCMNFYLDTPYSDLLRTLVPDFTAVEAISKDETPMNSAEDLIEKSVLKIKQEVMDDLSISSVNKNKEIVLRLHADGIFNLKNAVISCADLLGISKNTVYMHLRNLESK